MGSGIKSSMSMKYSGNPDLKEQLMKPGPGNYDGDLLTTKKSAAKYKLGTSPRFDRTKEKMSEF